MTMEHTLGPWKWDAEGTRGFPVLYGGHDGCHAILGLDPDGQRLYLCMNDPDAKLIASAPEMAEKIKELELQIERLQNALKHIIGFYGPGLDGSPEELAGKMARDALVAEGVKDFVAKREGESA